ncbi:ABC transporter permease [Agrobacterium vitis]|uniref:ABC transporter permease n=1 Tax=Rhizobium/Agrobacterium group TaxID=227290 RepID=UPI0008DC118C|nr:MULTISPECIES: ABC transporter permease [Rhizobium/Agrobacterium group]MCF1432641.1 ABC transporter permease [Allorhizobium ampelinum]MUO90151.1 ABC transporter permease [Agrobacterium vitis]MUZ51048.1 ABC transporter permease [Agrobacterium vitis]MUZ90625.1 ABC transporter permease [Agrobacterium vitis]MVA38571.1 ABC transporter permease [Agrobacterium vitis]
MRFERREHRPLVLVIATPIMAIVAALAISGILIAIAGAPVVEAYWRILIGAFGSRLSTTETLTRATPLMLTGLSAAVAFRARLWNIGAEGQLYLGAITVAAASSHLLGDFAPVVQIPALLILGALAGMVLLLVPLWLRLRFSVDEVVTTLLLNFVAVLFVSMLIDTVLKDPMAFGWPQSQSVADAAMLPKLLARSRLHLGLVIAVVLALVLHFVQQRTVFGIRSRAAGLNPAGAVFAGVPLGRTLVTVACISGGLAGLAGAVEVMGVKGYVTTDLSPGYGYSGIVVAMLANLNPLGVVLAALFTATMFVGADGMSRAMGIPSYIADVTVALSLLTMLVALFFTQYRIVR